jgi:hypothetical protein
VGCLYRILGSRSSRKSYWTAWRTETLLASVTWVTVYQSIRFNMPEEASPHKHNCENLKPEIRIHHWHTAPFGWGMWTGFYFAFSFLGLKISSMSGLIFVVIFVLTTWGWYGTVKIIVVFWGRRNVGTVEESPASCIAVVYDLTLSSFCFLDFVCHLVFIEVRRFGNRPCFRLQAGKAHNIQGDNRFRRFLV